MAVILMRHTTPDVAPGTCYGVTDLPLADSFADEAKAVLAALGPVSCILSSPLTRCLTLARHVGQARGLPVTTDPDWREMDFGTWEGMPWEDVPRDGLDAWAADFHHYAGHGGDSVLHLLARVTRALETSPEGALIVTHAGCIRAALAARDVPGAWEARIDFGGTVTL